MEHPADLDWMRRALELAEHGRGTVSPNPLVGCVVVCEGRAVGEGWHRRAGGPHAEVAALAAAGTAARGATAFVTLEPCDHTGRTGPCTSALLAAGIVRVVAAVADPDPRAAGGADTLRAAGVDVRIGIAGDEARRQNEVFFHGAATGRPFVVAKAAVSLDGRIAAADGTSQWLTGREARLAAHGLRGAVDAVLVGSGTVLADDPRLTVRVPGHAAPQPLRAVLDRRGRIAAGGRAWRVLDGSAPTVVLDEPDPKAVLAALWERGVRSVLVEGGAAVVSAFLQAGLVDKVVLHVAPLLLGEQGRPFLSGDGIATLAGAPAFRLDRVEQVGTDAVLTLYPAGGR